MPLPKYTQHINKACVISFNNENSTNELKIPKIASRDKQLT